MESSVETFFIYFASMANLHFWQMSKLHLPPALFLWSSEHLHTSTPAFWAYLLPIPATQEPWTVEVSAKLGQLITSMSHWT